MISLSPFQIKQTRPLQYEVYRGSAHIGSFWYANRTVYARASNNESLIATDIGLNEQKDICRWVYDEYLKFRDIPS